MKHQLTTLLLGEVKHALRGKVFQTQILQSAPHYFEVSIPRQVILGEETIKINEQEVRIELRGFPPDILVIQASLQVTNVFNTREIASLEEKIFEQCYKILKERGGNEKLSEIYSVFSVSDYTGNPEQFLKNSPAIATLLKSEKLELDPKEVDYTLSTQIKYGNNDLTVIDWDGAFLFDPAGDINATIELLTLANLQLLRYRILDRELDKRLDEMAELVKKPTKTGFLFKNKELARNLREIIKARMDLIGKFQSIERGIKLIGDWYSARFYDLAARKFKISEWRGGIKEKLEALEDIYSMVVENFGLSGKERAEIIQIVAFFVLQIGWFILIILEFIYFTR